MPSLYECGPGLFVYVASLFMYLNTSICSVHSAELSDYVPYINAVRLRQGKCRVNPINVYMSHIKATLNWASRDTLNK